jgi:hypothetical protein
MGDSWVEAVVDVASVAGTCAAVDGVGVRESMPKLLPILLMFIVYSEK